jgi:chorismate synthase
MTNADEVDEQREGRGSTARLTTSRITTAKVLSKQLTQAPVLAASDILTSIGESKAYSDNFNDSVAREEKVIKLMQGSKKLRNFVVKPRIHPRQLDDMKMNEAKRAFR